MRLCSATRCVSLADLTAQLMGHGDVRESLSGQVEGAMTEMSSRQILRDGQGMFNSIRKKGESSGTWSENSNGI